MAENVNINQSILLKRMGFDLKVRGYWLDYTPKSILEKESDFSENHNSLYSWRYSRPNYNEVCDWLREVKGIHITPLFKCSKEGIFHYVCNISYEECGQFISENLKVIGDDILVGIEDCEFPTYSKAQSAGIDEAINKFVF